ncbi:hypothetical protein D9C73_007316 [Collichthys lucidus]|uniref:Secreted protein n=1 Tax=Collichthys lucidus TaxID=240159 RepID=A0A4U5UGH9_COLLU|nr:hypothetical protein D9C73_007316 [Collichthys lucidus]
MMKTASIAVIMVLACFLSGVHFFHLGTDGERQTEGTDASRKRDTRSSAGHHKSEDTSDSREDEAAAFVSLVLVHREWGSKLWACNKLTGRAPALRPLLDKRKIKKVWQSSTMDK